VPPLVTPSEAAREPAPPEPAPAPSPNPPQPPPKPQPSQKAEAIKNKIIQTAGGFGFSYATEKETNDGGRVDIVLTKGDLVIACEISATTGVEHEWTKNLLKCLRAGYVHIAHICDNASRRKRLQERLAAEVDPEERGRIRFYTTAEFLEYIQSIAMRDKGAATYSPGDKTSPGQSVPMSLDEIEADRQRLLDELRRNLRRGSS
jgi:hypothetical protein